MNERALAALWDQLLDDALSGFESEPQGYEAPVYNTYSDDLVRRHRKSESELRNHVHNPVCGFPTAFDTACVAEVFATEFERTVDSVWRTRAETALDALEDWGVYDGVDEPRWDPVGWHFHAGSLSVTGTILNAKWNAMDILDRQHPTDGRWARLGEYLEGCRHGPGRFAHNTIPESAQAWDVQNTTAFALYLTSHRSHDASATDHDVYARKDDAVSHLLSGQRPDGFWPYIYPSKIQRALFRISPLRPFLEERMLGGDSSIFFGDISHQCYTMYLLLKSITEGDVEEGVQHIERAWTWLRRRLVETDAGTLRIAYEWEPEIDRVRYANVGDTMAYFLTLSMVPKLVEVGVLDRSSAEEIVTGLVAHLVDSLLERGETPCLPAHEKSRKERRHILPAVWWATSMKASLFSEFLREYRSGAHLSTL